MAYFDNAATSYPKPDVVYSFMDGFFRKYGGSAGRGGYALANTAKGIIDSTRSLLQELLHCPAKQVIFTPTATIAMNMILQGIIANGAKNIYISPFEHNAVTRVLHHFEQLKQINIVKLPIKSSLEYDFKRMQYLFDSVCPDLVVVSHASNVIGLISPVERIFLLAKEYGATTVVDMAQTAGVVEFNAGLETVDFAVFAGHKSMLGPTGISGFIMKNDYRLPPILFGGTGVDSANQDMPRDLPSRFEMGTANICGISGLNASLNWIKEKSIAKLFDQELEKRNQLLKILSEYDYITVVGNNPELDYVGIVSCLFAGISSDSAGDILNRLGISVRTGLQCAPIAHQLLGTYPAGTIRFSVNCFSNDLDFDELQNALSYINDNL